MTDIKPYQEIGQLMAESMMRQKDRDGRLFFGSFPIGAYSAWPPPGFFKRLILWFMG